MGLFQKRGFMPVLIAIGIVTMLAAMSMSMSLTNVMVLKKKIRMLNRTEGFYLGRIHPRQSPAVGGKVRIV